MAISKQKFRELLMQLLFSQDFSGPLLPETEKMLMQQLTVAKSALKEGMNLAQLIQDKFPEIDRVIASHSKEYEFNRIPTVEKSILRLAVYELFYDEKCPPKVVIAEGIRLARKFATPEASKFVNALLDAILRDKAASAILQ